MESKKGWCDIGTTLLIKADWNYKTEDEFMAAKLRENIRRNGQIESIIVREMPKGKYEVVNGNHRLDVMTELNMKTVHAFNLGKISDAAAKRIAVETNETRFESDSMRLAELVKEMTVEYPLEELEQSMPYSKEELENFQMLLESNWEQHEQQGEAMPEKKGAIMLKVSIEVYEMWLQLKSRLSQINGYNNDAKVFEFAIIEALNIPIDSLK